MRLSNPLMPLAFGDVAVRTAPNGCRAAIHLVVDEELGKRRKVQRQYDGNNWSGTSKHHQKKSPAHGNRRLGLPNVGQELILWSPSQQHQRSSHNENKPSALQNVLYTQCAEFARSKIILHENYCFLHFKGHENSHELSSNRRSLTFSHHSAAPLWRKRGPVPQSWSSHPTRASYSMYLEVPTL